MGERSGVAEADDPVVATDGVSFGRLVRTCAAFTTAGAGVLHLDAAGDHTEHVVVAGFFVVVAVAQLAWAAHAVRERTSRSVFAAGLALNAGVLGVWVISRTVGLPHLASGVGGVEELGWKDAAASGLAASALVAGGLALAMPAAAAAVPLTVRSGERMLRAMAAATLAVTIPGALVAHDHDHDHGGAPHEHLGADLAAVEVHEHGDGGGHDGQHAADEDDHGGQHVHAEVIEGDAHTPSSGPSSDAATAITDAAGHAHRDGHRLASGAATAAGAAHGHGHDDGAGHGPAPGEEPAAHAAHDHGPAGAAHAGDHAHAAATALPAVRALEGPGTVTTVRLGPFALLPSIPGLRMPHLSPAIPRIGPGEMNLLPLVNVPPPCRDCSILGMQPDLVYADGSHANLDTGPMLHHAVWTDTSRPDPVCGRDTLVGQLGHRVFASGNERTGFAAPEGFGVPVGRGTWSGAVELMNMSTELKVVFVQLTARWVPKGTPGIAPATPVWLDIDSCGDSAVDIGAGVSDLTWDWPSNLTGRVITAGGHVHDGGQWLSLTNRSTGEHLCTSIAGYGGDPRYRGALESMTVCSWDRLGTVRAGEVLRLTAHYNTTAPAKGVMGIMVVLVHETDDLTSGSPSPYPAEPPPDAGPVASHAHAH